MRNTIEDHCFSKIGLATYLGKSVRWIDYQLTGSHPPPRYRIGKSWIFRKSEIDRWLEQFRAGADLDQIVDDVMADLGGGQ